jgi:hypothetical protein
MFEELERSIFASDGGCQPARWTVGAQEVVLGDCLAGLRHLAASSVDVIVTSPPYNIGVDYRSYDDCRPREDYLAWLAKVGLEMKRVLKDEGSLFLNIGGTNRDAWLPLDVAAVFRSLFSLQNHITWVKSVSIRDDSFGHFKPIRSQRFLNPNHEAVFHFTKSGSVALDRLAVGVPFADKSNIARRGHKQDRRCAGNVWFIPYETVGPRPRSTTTRRASRSRCRSVASNCMALKERPCSTRFSGPGRPWSRPRGSGARASASRSTGAMPKQQFGEFRGASTERAVRPL